MVVAVLVVVVAVPVVWDFCGHKGRKSLTLRDDDDNKCIHVRRGKKFADEISSGENTDGDLISAYESNGPIKSSLEMICRKPRKKSQEFMGDLFVQAVQSRFQKTGLTDIPPFLRYLLSNLLNQSISNAGPLYFKGIL